MTKPSRNIPDSLRKQSPGGQSGERVVVQRQRPIEKPTTPGFGGVSTAIGVKAGGSAAKHGDAVGKGFGGPVGDYKA